MKILAFAALLFATPCAADPFLFGAFVNTDGTKSEQSFTDFETAIGRPLAYDLVYAGWLRPNLERAAWDISNGVSPMISYNTGGGIDGNCIRATAILSGAYDSQIAAVGQSIAALGGAVYIRFVWEMTDSSWGKCFVDDVPDDQKGPTYAAAYQHYVDIYRANGASNVRWVFNPGGDAYSSGKWSAYYPGAGYADWIAIDHYNKTLTPQNFATDSEIAAFYAAASPLGKPLMIGETGAPHTNANVDAQTKWVTTIHSSLPTLYPNIRAMTYFSSQGSVQDYRLVGAGFTAYSNLVNDTVFQ